jgi:hypothetical protein
MNRLRYSRSRRSPCSSIKRKSSPQISGALHRTTATWILIGYRIVRKCQLQCEMSIHLHRSGRLQQTSAEGEILGHPMALMIAGIVYGALDRITRMGLRTNSGRVLTCCIQPYGDFGSQDGRAKGLPQHRPRIAAHHNAEPHLECGSGLYGHSPGAHIGDFSARIERTTSGWPVD